MSLTTSINANDPDDVLFVSSEMNTDLGLSHVCLLDDISGLKCPRDTTHLIALVLFEFDVRLVVQLVL